MEPAEVQQEKEGKSNLGVVELLGLLDEVPQY